MNRQQYLQMRRTRHLNIQHFYQHYLNQAGFSPMPLALFSQVFPAYVQGNVDAIFKQLDKHFGIVVLSNAAGKEISYS